MAIIAIYPTDGKTIAVEVLDVYDAPAGKLAAVRALDGKPFVGGNTYPIRTEFTTVKVADLRKPGTEPQAAADPQPVNLLALAMAHQERRQWSAGESVWLWGDKKRGCYLKESHGFIELCLVGYQKSLPVFWLTPDGWQPARNLESTYQLWANSAKLTLKRS